MKTIFSKLHFDQSKKPKTLKASIEPPAINTEYGSLREGSIILSIMAKESSQGFKMSAGDAGDLIYALNRALEEMHEETYKLTEKVR